MFLTRCPACATTFRLTGEQLQARDGKVRCGTCRQVFNAQEHLLDEYHSPAPTEAPPLAQETPPLPASEPDTPPEAPESLPFSPDVQEPRASAPEPEPESGSETAQPLPAATEAPPAPAAEMPAAPSAELPPPLLTPESLAPPKDPIDAALETQPLSPDELKQQGLETGLLAARDLTEVPGFSRWSASPLEGLAPAPAPRALWPFVLASLLLVLALILQGAYHFRGELSRQLPTLGKLLGQLGVTVPLARQAEWISIEASDLQAENDPGHLILLATLRNRAAYPQEWPALELTLTDTYDAVLIRKVFQPRDYLPGDAAMAFGPGDTAIRLQLDADGLRPAGYRLYLFYP